MASGIIVHELVLLLDKGLMMKSGYLFLYSIYTAVGLGHFYRGITLYCNIFLLVDERLIIYILLTIFVNISYQCYLAHCSNI